MNKAKKNRILYWLYIAVGGLFLIDAAYTAAAQTPNMAFSFILGLLGLAFLIVAAWYGKMVGGK